MAGRQACPRFSDKAAQKGPASKEPQGKAETERQKARLGAVWTSRWRAERRHVPETVRDYYTMTRRLARNPLIF